MHNIGVQPFFFVNYQGRPRALRIYYDTQSQFFFIYVLMAFSKCFGNLWFPLLFVCYSHFDLMFFDPTKIHLIYFSLEERCKRFYNFRHCRSTVCCLSIPIISNNIAESHSFFYFFNKLRVFLYFPPSIKYCSVHLRHNHFIYHIFTAALLLKINTFNLPSTFMLLLHADFTLKLNPFGDIFELKCVLLISETSAPVSIGVFFFYY